MAVAAAGLGVVLISEALSTPLDELDWSGIGLALSAGAFWAAYIVLSGRTGAEFPRLEGLAIAMVVATAVTLPLGIGSVPLWTPETLVKGLGIAVLSSVLPYSLELLALRRLSAKVFGILLSLEPAAAALAGLIVLGQHLTPTQLLGMGLVVAASALVLGLGARKDPAESTGGVSARARASDAQRLALVAAGLHQAEDRGGAEDEHDGRERHPDRDLRAPGRSRRR